jgi:hypothetical protein
VEFVQHNEMMADEFYAQRVEAVRNANAEKSKTHISFASATRA